MLFGKKEQPKQPEAEPTPPAPNPSEERLAKLEEAVTGVATTVKTFIEGQHQQQAVHVAPPPEEKPIEDISDEDYADAIEEGGTVARKAIEIRRKADSERMRREIESRVAPLQTQGLAAINENTIRMTLAESEYYKSDPEIKKGVDAGLNELKARGILIDPQAIKWIHDSVVGGHTQRLLDKAKEEFVRQKRDDSDLATTKLKRSARQAVERDTEHNTPTAEDLTPHARDLLATRNRGRGQSEDEFAQALPPRRVKDPETGRAVTRKYEDFDDYMKQYEEAKEEFQRQREGVFGR